ncbi:twin-arginine translocase subunit TatC, partial [Candidatus Woesearchaeota archaeon]|nr:twin-arginine translocase subunit TatC [Candidatus Woesearchaeota archaeon]
MKKTVISHLEELRSRLVVVAIAFVVLCAAGIWFSGWFISVLISNLTLNIPVKFVSLSPFEFIAAQIKIGLFVAVVLCAPVLAYETAMFVRPALRRKERK